MNLKVSCGPVKDYEHACEIIEMLFPGVAYHSNLHERPNASGNYRFFLRDDEVILTGDGRIIEQSLLQKLLNRFTRFVKTVEVRRKVAESLKFQNAWRAYPSSSVIHFHEAAKIVAKFGRLVSEMSDPRRHTFDDAENERNYSFPLERLSYSKHQVQVALAVYIAELVVRSVVESPNQHGRLIYYAATTSGHLVWFTRQPVALRTSGYMDLEFGSEQVYSEWNQMCVRHFTRVSAEPIDLKNDRDQFRAMMEYWRIIDSEIPRLLNEPILIAIRAT